MSRTAPLLASIVLAACSSKPPANGPTGSAQHVAPPHDAAPAEPANDGKPMSTTDDLQVIRNDTVQFVTFRPPGAQLPTRERQVRVAAPPEAVALARSGDITVVDRLVPLLADPQRAWAAEVMLAAMTGHEADMVNDFQRDPDKFLETFGQGIKERWEKWLGEHRSRLQWDESRLRFVVK